MANDKLTLQQKKEWAKTLYLQGEQTQKAIAEKVGISEVSLSKWVDNGGWKAMKTSLLTSKETVLRHLYAILERTGNKLNEEDSIGDSKIADMYAKYTASIRNLEIETSVQQIIEVATMFIKWVKEYNPDLAGTVTEYFDKFITARLKRF